MLGWDKGAAAWASLRNLSAKRSSAESESERSFTATRRWRTMSSASHTEPMPPTAMRSTSRYRWPSSASVWTSATALASLPSQGGFDDCLGDRRGHGAPGRIAPQIAAVQHHDRHHDPGVLSGGEGYKPGVGLATRGLRRPRLPRDLDT